MKKSAVLCEQCSLIAHTRCAPNAPPTCDLRSQLLLYAQYAENGTPTSPYINPMDIFTAAQSVSPSTPMSDGGFSSRPSLDAPSSSPSPYPTSPPPTAFRVLAKFKRSHSSLTTNDSDPNHSAHALPTQNVVKPKRSVLKRNPASRERPASVSSSSASPRSSSMRSAVTATESLASQRDTIRQSTSSIIETDSGRSDPRLSRMTSLSGISATTQREESVPGNMPRESRHRKRDRDSKSSSSGCLVQ